MRSPHHKNVLILGASSDIAIAIAKKYAKGGAQLTLAGRNTEMLAEIASDLSIRFDISVSCSSFDALNFSSHDAFYQQLQKKPDVVICVFGYLGDQAKAQAKWLDSEKIISTNYTGAVSILNVVANDMERRKRGVIVGISSVAGDRGKLSNYIYGSAKAGFTAYLSGLRNRLYHAGVHVLTVKPGFVYTRMTSNMKLPGPLTATPEQIASQVIRAVETRKNVLYSLKRWWLLMLIIRNLPEFVFKRLKL